MTIAFRLLEPDDKGAALHEAVAQLTTGTPKPHTFPVEPASLQQVPGSPFAYWVSESLRRMFSSEQKFEAFGRKTCIGLTTSRDVRLERL